MKTKGKIMFVISAAAVIALLIAGPSLLAGSTGAPPMGGPGGPGGAGGGPGGAGGRGRPGGNSGAGTVFSVRTEAAEIRTLQAYLEINGNIVNQQQVAVVPEAGGKLVSLHVDMGSTVRKGALVAQVDPSRPGAAYSLSPVYAPVSGVVVSRAVSEGATVSTATTLFTIAATDTLEIEALIPEREVGQLRIGLTAEVRLEAFPGEVFAAEVANLSPVVDPVSRTKEVSLRFIYPDRRVNPGMFARIKLNTRVYQNVISIPQDAVMENRGAAVVYVLDTADGSSRVRMREVTAGVSIDGETEIKNGLEAGEAVIVQGQQFLTDGAAVRVIGRN